MLATVVQCQCTTIIIIGGVFAIYFQMIVVCVACIVHTIHEHDEKISSLIMENQLNLLLLVLLLVAVASSTTAAAATAAAIVVLLVCV